MRTAATVFVSLSVLIGSGGCQRRRAAPPPISFSGPTMGTRYSVKLAALPDGVSREQIQTELDRRLESVNHQMSTYQPDSELSRFNRQTGTGWFAVSPNLVTVVTEALRVSRWSGGRFDVTVGPLVNLWNFGPDAHPKQLPTETAITAARQRVGYQQLEVRADPPALRKTRPDLYVDLSAIAKGFAVDQLAEYLAGLKTPGYLVEIGGEMRAGGNHADGSPWQVGIEQPTPGHRGIERIIRLKNQAIATSGDYRNFFEINGKRYSHTIDPRTGRPVTHQLTSVSVIAETCTTADALATAVMVLGPVEGYNKAVADDRPVLLIVRDGGRFVEKATPAFKRLFGNSAEGGR